MTTTALTLSVISLLVAFGSLAWSIISGRRSGRAISREESRREEEIAQLRKERVAELVGELKGSTDTSGDVYYSMSVRNVGRCAARDVKVWLTLHEGTDPLAGPKLTESNNLGALTSEDDPVGFVLLQRGPLAGGKTRRVGRIVASWSDESGDHVGAIGELTVFV